MGILTGGSICCTSTSTLDIRHSLDILSLFASTHTCVWEQTGVNQALLSYNLCKAKRSLLTAALPGLF